MKVTSSLVLVVVVSLVRWREEEVLISHRVSLQVRRFSDLNLTARNWLRPFKADYFIYKF